ncbi:MAG: hypothetical protein WBP61_10920, partial [Nocardioides sp.]
QQQLDATVAEPGAASTAWSFSFPSAAAGSYTATIRATDQDDNVGTATRTFSVGGADTADPDSVITSPNQGATLQPPTATVTGSSTDDVGVASVTILVKDRDTGNWLKNDGSWSPGTANAQRLATMATPGASSTTWTIDIPLGAGSYLVTARARDAAGNQDNSPASRQFLMRVADSVDPNGTMTSPTQGSTVAMGPVELTGEATDNLGVDVVLVAIKDTVTQEWLRPNGTWARQYASHTTTLADRGATSTAWSFDFTPPVARKYAVSVIARDAAGNQDPTKPWVTFTVQ